jgi:N-acetylglutamate synthase-like GNAT family acetyltransferase
MPTSSTVPPRPLPSLPGLPGSYEISDDPARIDVDAAHAFLSRSYWAADVPRAMVEQAVRGSLCFGVYHQGAQVGFARVITDKATFAYLADVYILEAHRGQGLSKHLVATITAHPQLQGLRRFMLATRDAHGLYAQFGFSEVARPERLMEILNLAPCGQAR